MPSDEQIDALDRMMQPFLRAERKKAQKELIERMIQQIEGVEPYLMYTDGDPEGDEREVLIDALDWLRSYLPTEDTDGDD